MIFSLLFLFLLLFEQKGKFRSPEEYRSASLTEKIDIYSLGHIFYSILHGESSTENIRVKHKKTDFDGKVNIGLMSHTEIKFAKLTEKMFSLSPEDRPNATQIIMELMSMKEEVGSSPSFKDDTNTIATR